MKTRLFLLLIAVTMVGCGGSKFKYQSVEGDPTKSRIYTLDNGLKVYMSVNPETPRIQTFIAVKVGGKNDPAQTTGLAHYFEHLMFKGTKQFGTQNYEAEKPMLDQIEQLFETYRQTTDSAQRVAIYRTIDSISYEASKLAIPNEYDKLMAAIGANGTNAWTSYDETCYMEDIPTNQVENWAKIQADRFKNNVIRGFHTELETVYEEKNMSLTNDFRKLYEAMAAALFQNHPYGTQTVLGTQEHLKNPSITNIKNYYNQWYVPNNMAICVAGDFNPDSMIMVIDRYFGDMKPNPNLPKLSFKPEEPITKPIEKDVFGLEAENISIGYRFPGANSDDYLMLQLIGSLMANGKSGIMDVNITQKQRLLSSYAAAEGYSDYSVFGLNGVPKAGQTLEDTKAILLEQIEILKKGDFDESLLKAVINNYKLSQTMALESNFSRAYQFVSSFINDIAWDKKVSELERISKITKQQVVDFANANFKDNYAAIYKRQGKDPNELKINKPTITPIFTNRDTASTFLREVQNSAVKPIEPVFLSFDKDITFAKADKDVPVMYIQNTSNDIFTMKYIIDYGSDNDKKLSIARSYLDFLGTSKYTPEQIKQKFYEMACSFGIAFSDDKTTITLSGLSENQQAAMQLMEELISDAQPNEEALKNLKEDMLKKRYDAKANQRTCFNALQSYALYGKNSPYLKLLSNKELEAVTSAELIDLIKSLFNYQQKVAYYGPYSAQEFVAMVNQTHKLPATLKTVSKESLSKKEITKEDKILLAPYDAAQIYYIQYSNRDDKFDAKREAANDMYNEYFGSGMNSIVFQEMREARGLAYSAWARMNSPYLKNDPYSCVAFIATQNDKMIDAVKAFEEIIVNMPVSESAFKIAKDGYINRVRTQRINKLDVIEAYLDSQELGLDYDIRKDNFNAVQNMTLEDVIKYQQQYVKDNKWTYAILGREKDLDMKTMSKYGKIQKLTLEDIFGY